MTATITFVAGSELPRPMAAVIAIRKFDGPPNGIMLNPKAVAKIIRNSVGVAILRCHLSHRFTYRGAYKCNLYSQRLYLTKIELAVYNLLLKLLGARHHKLG